MTRIAIIGMACRYPDAASPEELWANVVSRRRAFRRLPDERTPLADYHSPDPAAEDRFSASNAALIEGYEFDRVGFRIAGSTYRSTDLTHWLALDMAARALADAGFPGGEGLPRESTAVIVGNTLTGEFTRANVLRLRWPYVRRAVASVLSGQPGTDVEQVLGELEKVYKAPFPPVDADTLAGGLANTIAGRICNYFDLGGGGYTVDGACSSSLLSITHACRALVDGDADVAVAGGVDLSVDPFELVGFAKTGALAADEMRVYDRRSAGFWPGEGCGMLVLAREEHARALGHRIYALIAGWGVSSDGSGGITRPEVAGQRRALTRAYERAGFAPSTVGYFEGHGTGTAVGDATEIAALSAVRAGAVPAVLGTVKANIGHTKAAAGVAGVIKAAMAVHEQLIPPTTGCVEPHPALDGAPVRVTDRPEPWPVGPRRAGVSSMGFGGINTHIVLADAGEPRRTPVIGWTAQDVELLLFDADTPAELVAKVSAAAGLATRSSYANIGDLAARLRGELAGRPVRAAVVAASPSAAASRLTRLAALVSDGAQQVLDGDVCYGRVRRAPRIVFAFPGQGSGRGDGATLRNRFADVDGFLSGLALPAGDPVETSVAQPRIAAVSAATLRLLTRLGITAGAAVGHSLGELTALHWAGVMDAATLVRLAARRGRLMTDTSVGAGAMAGIAASAAEVAELLGDNGSVVIAGLNAPRQTVVAGPAGAVDAVVARAERDGLRATRLPVSHAFHSPQVSAASGRFADYLAAEELRPPRRPVVSTVTGAALPSDTDVPALLARQITAPVRFAEALAEAAADADLVVEVGPGRVLAGLVAETVPVPVVATDASLAGVLRVAAAGHVLGAPVRYAPLFDGRYVKPLPETFRFFANPCEVNAPEVETVETVVPAEPPGGSLELVRRLAAERAELPLEAVDPDSGLLDELHLSSITVGQLVADAVRAKGLPPAAATISFATATVRQIAEALDEFDDLDGTPGEQSTTVDGVAPWVRPFAVEFVAAAPPARTGRGDDGAWQVFASPGHPLAERLRDDLQHAGIGGGVLVCLSPGAGPGPALAGAKAALAGRQRFVLVHHGAHAGAAGLAKSLFLEAAGLDVVIVEVPAVAEAVPWVVAEAGTGGFTEVRYDRGGARTRPVLRVLSPAPPRAPLSDTDVLLVTGGGKGITAECALAMSAGTGARVALLGRSSSSDTELAANLQRFSDAGVDFRYLRADVTDPTAVRAAVEEVTRALGDVTAVLHGAGRNVPRRLSEVDDEELAATLAPKVGGLRAVLDAVDAAKLRLLVSFGSIIGRAGLAGEAHYATANAALAEATERFGRAHPHCRCVTLEWSVWAGAGMGERLGVVDSLRDNGITPVTVEDGLAVLRDVLARDTPPALVVSGRVDGLPTIAVEQREPPLSRFTDRVLVDYPGVELVTEAELSTATDPYLDDHALDGNLLFPAVLGMEAMTQVARAVAGRDDLPALERVEFTRPIVVPPGGTTAIRVAALVRDQRTVDVVIRSAESGFAADHFRATCRFPRPALVGEPAPPPADRLPIDPRADLYGATLFQGRRFQRLVGYQQLSAARCVAEIDDSSTVDWFGRFLPDALLLGDPGVRDAFMQAIQGSRPDQTLLPVGVERVVPGTLGTSRLVLAGLERLRERDEVVWDLTARDESGAVVERWEGLRLRVVATRDDPLPPALLGPYLERRLDELRGGPAPEVAVRTSGGRE